MIKEFEEKFDELLKVLSNVPEWNGLTLDEFRKMYGITDMSKRDKPFIKKTVVHIMSDLINNVAWYNFMIAERERGSQVWSFTFEHHNPKILSGLKVMLPMNSEFI